MFGSEAASLIDSTQNVINSWFNNGLNIANHIQSKKQLQLQEKAFEWQKYYDQNQTQIRVDDMAKAGLNPILAAGSAGATGVSGVSASPSTPSAPSQGNLSSLVETLMQKEQLKQQAALAREANQTAKDVAETKAESDEKIAELNAATSASNAALNAQTQTQIATANNDALKDVRSAQERNYNAESEKTEWQNAYNQLLETYNGNPSSVAGFVHDWTARLSRQLGRKVDSLEVGKVLSDKLAKAGKVTNGFYARLFSALRQVKTDRSFYED